MFRIVGCFRMNNTQFFNSFVFVRFRFQRYRFTDHFKTNGAPRHYIGRMVNGHAKLKTRKNYITVSEGDIFYIPKGLKYQSFWYGDAHDRITFDSFGFDYFPNPQTTGFTLQKIYCSEDVANILNEISGDMPENCTTVGKLYTFLGAVLDNMRRESVHYKDITTAAIEYMHAHTDYTMSDVAEYCGISRTGLYEIFRKAYNLTPNEMKQKILCEKAAELLTTTNLSVEEISSRLNFSSSSYFRKVLKKHTGKSPLDIRKESQF